MEQYEKMIDKIFSEFKDIRYGTTGGFNNFIVGIDKRQIKFCG